jgi:hypothetical protein
MFTSFQMPLEQQVLQQLFVCPLFSAVFLGQVATQRK